jgi:NAD(P)H-hydrate epimerase
MDAEMEWAAVLAAGRGVAEAVCRDFLEIGPLPEAFRVLVLSGTGHNAADALVAARVILEELPGASATVLLAYGRERMRPLAAKALAELESHGARVQIFGWVPGAVEALAAHPWEVCLEGVAGMNLKSTLREPAPELFAAVKKAKIALRAAVDLPAGLCDAGAFPGFAADFTYATGIVKSPVLAPGAVPRTGRVRLVNLGFFDAEKPVTERELLLSSTLAALAALRDAAGDKRSHGHLALLGGAPGMPGAAALAAKAAATAGAGLLTVFTAAETIRAMAALVPEAMWTALPEMGTGFDAEGSLAILRKKAERFTALAIGPGLDFAEPSVRSLVTAIVRESPLPLLLDAGALFPEVVDALAQRPAGFPKAVLTPHMGEFLRLAGLEKAPADAELEGLLKDFARKARCVLLLKGPVTRVTDGTRLAYSTLGGPVLARGGSGDLLSGILGALLALPGVDPFEAACTAALWHGAAAEHLAREKGQKAVRTSEIVEHLSPALRES